jgi:retinol dehydrogenase-14
MFTVSLSERLRGTAVTAHCLHPGTIATQIGNKLTMRRLHAWAWTVNAWLRSTSIDNGAKTSVFLATSDQALARPGQYWASYSRVWNIPYRQPRIEPTHPLVADSEARAALWTTSEQLCQFVFPRGEIAR